VTRTAISTSFTAFCQQLLAAYQTAPIVVVGCPPMTCGLQAGRLA
jgi:hypothetical protein